MSVQALNERHLVIHKNLVTAFGLSERVNLKIYIICSGLVTVQKRKDCLVLNWEPMGHKLGGFGSVQKEKK